MKQTRNPIGWFEIYVQDMKRAQAFYEKTFEVKLSPLPSPIIQMLAFPGGRDGYGCPGSLVKMEGKESGGGARSFISPATTARSNPRAPQKTAARSSSRSFPSASTVSFPSSSIRRGT